jgi:hypothetical protein
MKITWSIPIIVFVLLNIVFYCRSEKHKYTSDRISLGGTSYNGNFDVASDYLFRIYENKNIPVTLKFLSDTHYKFKVDIVPNPTSIEFNKLSHYIYEKPEIILFTPSGETLIGELINSKKMELVDNKGNKITLKKIKYVKYKK